MIKDRLYFSFAMAIILLASLMMACAAYLAFVPVKVIAPQQQPYKVITKTVRPGDTFIYQVDICKFREAPTKVIRRYVDENGTAYPLPPEESNIKKGCMKSNVPLVVPMLHPGVWYLTLDVEYQVNPLRVEPYHLTTDKFTITQ